jgi:hypothetical protein
VNQRMKASQVNPPAPNLTDMGWVAMRIGVSVPRTLWSIDVVDREAMVKVCGVAMAKLQGQSWVPHLSNGERMNVGTTSIAPYPASNQLVGGKTCRSLMLSKWGGGVVVVRGRESRLHGEGLQRVCSNRAQRGGRL